MSSFPFVLHVKQDHHQLDLNYNGQSLEFVLPDSGGSLPTIQRYRSIGEGISFLAHLKAPLSSIRIQAVDVLYSLWPNFNCNWCVREDNAGLHVLILNHSTQVPVIRYNPLSLFILTIALPFSIQDSGLSEQWRS